MYNCLLFCSIHSNNSLSHTELFSVVPKTFRDTLRQQTSRTRDHNTQNVPRERVSMLFLCKHGPDWYFTIALAPGFFCKVYIIMAFRNTPTLKKKKEEKKEKKNSLDLRAFIPLSCLMISKAKTRSVWMIWSEYLLTTHRTETKLHYVERWIHRERSQNFS